MTVFYVNTASTAGGDGSTNATVGANRAFASLREAIRSPNLDVSDARTIYCSGTDADTLSITQQDWDQIESTPTNYILIIGDWPGGAYSTAHYRIEVTNTNLLYNNHPGHVRIQQLQGKINVTDSGEDYVGFRLSTRNVGLGRTDCDCRISRCSITKTGAGTSIIYGFYNSEYAETNGGLIRLWNNSAIGCQYGYGSAWSEVTNYNNTGRGNIISDFVDPQVCINCLGGSISPSVACLNNVGTGGGLSDYNASTDGSASAGAHSVTGRTFTFFESGSVELASNDTGAMGRGVTDPASGLFLDDFEGNLRTIPWAIGASQPLEDPTITVTNMAFGALRIG